MGTLARVVPLCMTIPKLNIPSAASLYEMDPWNALSLLFGADSGDCCSWVTDSWHIPRKHTSTGAFPIVSQGAPIGISTQFPPLCVHSSS